MIEALNRLLDSPTVTAQTVRDIVIRVRVCGQPPNDLDDLHALILRLGGYHGLDQELTLPLISILVEQCNVNYTWSPAATAQECRA